MTIHCAIPLIGFCAYSGTGKTTLLGKLIPLLKGRGLRLALLKHAHHSFDIDQPERIMDFVLDWYGHQSKVAATG